MNWGGPWFTVGNDFNRGQEETAFVKFDPANREMTISGFLYEPKVDM